MTWFWGDWDLMRCEPITRQTNDLETLRVVQRMAARPSRAELARTC